MQTIVEYRRPARPLGVLLALAVLIVAAPAMAQSSSKGCPPELELAPGTAMLCRFPKAIGTVITGDNKITDAQLANDRTVVLHAKKLGTTNVIVLDAQGDEMLNAAVAVAPEAGYRVTMHTLRADIKKFWVYRCAPGALCELVEEPKVVVSQEAETVTESTTEGPAGGISTTRSRAISRPPQ